jgi:hypothetical protein
MVNPNQQQTPQSYLRTITIIHLALVAGQILFAVVVLNITREKGIDLHSTNDPFFFAALILAVAAMVGSVFIFQKLVADAVTKFTLKEKLMTYQSALIVRFALLQGASMFAIVVNMLTGNLFYLIISCVLILSLIIIRPTKNKIENDLNLSYEDKILFESSEPL